MTKFNMNNYVWFEPTELGVKVYEDYYKELNYPCTPVIVNGKAKLQFNDFIHIYGVYITSYIGKDKEVFKKYEFFIKEDSLI